MMKNKKRDGTESLAGRAGGFSDRKGGSFVQPIGNDAAGGGYMLITGRYETGSPEIKAQIAGILGTERTAETYRLYFYWYNVLHELGHAILHFNAHPPYTDFEEEPLVNAFAVAFWSLYGEKEKMDALRDLVNAALSRCVSPAPSGMGYREYARRYWGTPAFFTFNNYAWVQFHSVAETLRRPKPLGEVLSLLSDRPITEQLGYTLAYDLGEKELPLRIVREVVPILREWGISLPDLPHRMVDDPSRHGISTAGF